MGGQLRRRCGRQPPRSRRCTRQAASPPARAAAPRGNDGAVEALHRAAGHGDEHVIKFTDTAVDAFGISGDPDLLAAAGLARELIPS